MSEPARPEPTDATPPRLEKPGPEKPIRASDAEREQVAAVVRRAVGDGRLTLVEGDERLAGVYASVHRGELARFTDDLGEDVATPSASAETAEAPAPHHGSPVLRPATTSSIAVMGEAVRRGDWVPGQRHVAIAVMGGADLRLADARLDATGLDVEVLALMGGAGIDLRGADLRGPTTTIRAVAIMGGVVVVVDPDTRVQVDGVGFMGGFADEAGPASRRDGPLVRVTGFAHMGGVTVQRRRLGIDAEGRPEPPETDDPQPRGIRSVD